MGVRLEKDKGSYGLLGLDICENKLKLYNNKIESVNNFFILIVYNELNKKRSNTSQLIVLLLKLKSIISYMVVCILQD
jgi:hypothetical protein